MEHTVREQNGKVTVTVTRPIDDRGLYRATAVGAGGGRLLLGTLIPQGGRLILTRTLSVDALRQRGCYPIATVETALAHAFSGPAASSPPSFPDDILRRAFAASPRGRWQATGDGFTLTFPYDPAAPFPMAPIFCLAQVVRLEGRFYLRYHFDKMGNPRLDA